ncbi:zinc finger protein 358 [Tribolium castaneum]|uniref:Zinc finger protein 160-like Protein n=1 Tax=Tribolium castaneum TaxID=7070 RepID=D6W9I5_TRICA|nr:PREDICTED: zinc finger protein 358 [Tribolium castaneum]EEZ98149.1 Zinc finger protein 160-like Protein [Tribolium castaneum]|eukprot:XP_972742.1 PREDICTED: zinc finger protein 358 [Tribolium castaneum]
MKTYSRKKSGEAQDVILDLNELCRLCMAKEDELVPIFNSDEAIPLTLRIMACVALEVFEGDGLPNKICHPCKFQLEKSYNFRKKCENSDMKLRQHLKSLQAKIGDADLNVSGESEAAVEESQEKQEDEVKEPSTEEDLVGVTQVAYIQPDPEPEDDPESITLPADADVVNKDACTLKSLKREVMDVEDNEGDGVIFVDEASQEMEDTSYDAIADAVKATLATQPGFDVSGQLQMKIIPTEGKLTQVEVTTENGTVIVMELMTEEEAEAPQMSSTVPEVNEEGELKIFKCPQCPKSFARRIQLRRHASVHMQQRGFSCGMCEKWFPTRSALVRHERIHTGERPFQCEICQKSFAQKEILYRHLMTHSGQKPYNCTHCNKGFTQREPLRIHLRTHMTEGSHDINLHYCSLCPKVFCHASGLSRHLVTHTGKTFKCRDCDRSFTDKSSLRRHHKQTLHQP